MKTYLDLARHILENGTPKEDRTGTGTISIFGYQARYSLDRFPLLTTKKVAWKTCLKELLWFIKGNTDNILLKNQNVTIWDGNGSREFLDQRGLFHLREHDLGPVYGHQWRHFNAPYTSCEADYTGQGIDQLNDIITQLKNPDTRNSRRLVMSAWNPCQLNEMALPPCHVLVQFNVINGDQLACSLYQRSGDVGLGVPFNIASYSFLTHLIAYHCGLKATEFIYYLGNCHIYDDHFDQVKEQLTRTPYEFPTLEILNKRENINDYVLEDFKISNYQHHPPIKAAMRA